MPSIENAFAQLGQINAANDANELFNTFDGIIRDLGGVGFAIGSTNPSVIARVPCKHRNFRGWVEHFAAENYFKDCAVTQNILTTTRPFRYEQVRLRPELTARNLQVFGDADDMGLHYGLLVPVHSSGGRRGWVSILMDEAEVDLQSQLSLVMLAMAAHAELEFIAHGGNNADPKLSAREREVLRWLANGKSAEDAGEILGITGATVMYHYHNVARRYGTLNRTQTVVEAMRRGAITLD